MSTAALATFLLALVPTERPEPSELTRYAKDALEKLWSGVCYYPDLTCDQLCHLLELTQRGRFISMRTVLQEICGSLSGLRKWAGLSADSICGSERSWEDNKLTAHLEEVLVPFVGKIVN